MILDKPLKWTEIKHLVDIYALDKLGRSESQLQSYHDFKDRMAKDNVNLTTNLFIKTLKWLPADTDIHLPAEEALKLIKYENPLPFSNPNDVRITVNDFPYYIEGKTLHLLVWLKFPMDPDPESEIGDIDAPTKRIIEKYVNLTFVKHAGINRNDIIWWKNYTAIQSIKTIPHIHVLINLSDDFDGEREKSARALIGKSGVMFRYDDRNDGKL